MRQINRLAVPVVVLLAVTGGWIATYRQRLALGATNIDDYLYTLQTETLLRAGPLGLWDAWRADAANSPLVPMLSVPFAAVNHSPTVLVISQLFWLLAFVVALRWLLHGLRVPRVISWCTAGIVAGSVPFLFSSVLINFGLASSTCFVGVLAAYLASDRLRRRLPSVAFGLILGLLLLSRVLAPAYLAALAVPIALDLAIGRWGQRLPRVLRRWPEAASPDSRRTAEGAASVAPPTENANPVLAGAHVAPAQARGTQLRNLILATLVCLVVALPWWIDCGVATWRYLRSYGLSSESIYTRSAGIKGRILMRITHTAYESGWTVVAVTFIGALALGVTLAVGLARRRPNRRAIIALTAGVLAFVVLLSSTNLGTGFAMPSLAVLLSMVVAASLRAFVRPGRAVIAAARSRLRWALRGVAAAGAMLVTGGTLVAQTVGIPAPPLADIPIWRTELASTTQFWSALGCRCTVDTDALNADIVGAVPTRRLVALRFDVVVNKKSLQYVADRDGRGLRVEDAGDVTDDLANDDTAFITGSSIAPYTVAPQEVLEAKLVQRGYVVARQWHPSPYNLVTLWLPARFRG